ncbi:Non-specific serine/threonine protein kinase [Aphelenchoides bicaudatus]|nr:Non-specific serine/threonine protein kinase [Aphelenchoides bicaudatus]
MGIGLWRLRSKKLKTSDISAPSDCRHLIHAFIDQQTGRILGLPKQWSSIVEVETINRRKPLISTEQTTCMQFPGRIVVGASSPSTSASSSTPASFAVNNNDPPVISKISRPINSAPNGSSSRQLSIDDVRNTLKEMVDASDDPRNDLHSVCVLGTGSSGSVLNVYRTSVRRNLALKKMALKSQQRPELLISELTIMKQCRHPNIIEYINSYFINDCDELWILMEPALKGALTDYLLERRLNEAAIATIAAQCLDALTYLHSRNIVHRDLKSDSILFANNMIVKLSDFGFAATLTSSYPRRRSLLGSTYWLPPEIANREFHGTSADIWSFGITVIEMIQGTPPHYNCLPSIAIELIKTEKPTVPAEYRISAELRHFLDSMLVREPERRSTAAALQQHDFLQIGLEDPTELRL